MIKNLAKSALILALSLTLASCSKSNASTRDYNGHMRDGIHMHDQIKVENTSNRHHRHMHDEVIVDDLVKVDFMDENFDMSQIEDYSCCHYYEAN